MKNAQRENVLQAMIISLQDFLVGDFEFVEDKGVILFYFDGRNIGDSHFSLLLNQEEEFNTLVYGAIYNCINNLQDSILQSVPRIFSEENKDKIDFLWNSNPGIKIKDQEFIPYFSDDLNALYLKPISCD